MVEILCNRDPVLPSNASHFVSPSLVCPEYAIAATPCQPGFFSKKPDFCLKSDLPACHCVAHVTRYSSTPAGGALRVAVFATHSEEQIERLLRTLADVL
jgi:hypothetical protein